ncbi:uncharacterized protein LOC110675671 [Aedes aegypti]|uniref:Uncharacterized protein n=1 Tax=Aedes aegypti TaxID=7159 RepID=A0A6I8TYU6_AEDAE|nr:uncharacterized protein LOC110675671 [Aedes aegypti]
MDQISLTDLRRQFFGPTLDESVLHGVDCLRDLFCGERDDFPRSSRERRHSNRVVSDLHLYQSCRDVSIRSGEDASADTVLPKKEHEYGSKELTRIKKPSLLKSDSSKNSSRSLDLETRKRKSSKDSDQDHIFAFSGKLKEEKQSSQICYGNVQENVSKTSTEEKFSKESSKEDVFSGKKRSIGSSSVSKEYFKPSRTGKLSSSSEQSSKTKSSSGSSKNLEKLKKDLANSFIFETKTSPPSPATRERHTPRTSRHSTLRSLSSPPPKASTNARRPKQIRTRWAFVKVNEFDDGAKTYEVLQTDLQVVDVERLKDSLAGTISATDLPPEAPTEIVFAALPDGSSLCYRGKDIKR